MTLSPRFKLLLAFVGLIAVTTLIGWLLITLFFGEKPSIEEGGEEITQEEEEGRLTLSEEIEQRGTAEEEVPTGLQPSAVAEGREVFTQRLTASSVTEPTIVGDAIVFYNSRDGLFYMIDDSGELIAITDQAFKSADTVTIAASGDIAALEFPDGSNIIYDLETGKQTTLPNHWEDFAFSADGEEVVSKSLVSDPNANALIISNSDGSRTQVVAGLGNNEKKVTANVSPNNNIVAFSETGTTQSGFGRNEIYLLDVTGTAIGSLVVEGGNFSAFWSPSGSSILYSVSLASNADTPSLWLTNATGDIGSTRDRLDLQTWVEKCTFENETAIICAAPREVTAGSGIDHRLISAPDDVYRLNLETGRVTLLAIPATDTQMSNLSVSSDKTILYYTDEYGRLNFIRLK